MNTRMPIEAVMLLGVFFLFASPAIAEGKFQKLTGSQIRATVSGMEITDDVHWRDFFEANGTVTSQSMGRKRTGKWRIQKDGLCLELGSEGGCYEVWLSGKNVQLRPLGSGLPLEGVLQRPTRR